MQQTRFCANRKCSLERLLTKGRYGAQNAGNIGRLPCISAKVSPAAPRFRLRRATLPPPAAHLPAAARLGAVVGGGATDSCDGGVQGYTCASGLQRSLPGPPGPATAAAPKEKRA